MFTDPKSSVLPITDGAAQSDVSRRAMARLRASHYRALHAVRCDFDRGTLRLRGVLPSYYLKQIAQAVVSELQEVRALDNRIAVKSASFSAAVEEQKTEVAGGHTTVVLAIGKGDPPLRLHAPYEGAADETSADDTLGTAPMCVNFASAQLVLAGERR
jgi:hypothetical protein